MTRIAKGVQAGERWDKVRLSTGLEGYVFQNYIKEYSYNKVNSVNINVSNIEVGINETYQLHANITPTNATYKNVMWNSNNTDIVTVSDTGVVTGIKEGTAIITVTTEDQLKTSNVIVTVGKKEPSITIDKESYIVLAGKSVPYKVVVKDSDILEYDVKIDNENIARIEDGKIIGVSEGISKIIVNIKGTEILKEARVEVIQLKDGDISIDENLNVDGDIISKVKVGTTANEIKNNIRSNYNLNIKDINDKEIEDEEIIGTDTKIEILDINNEVVYEYHIVVFGEVTGDGKINSGDLLRIVKHLNSTSIINNKYVYEAADVTNDEKINSGDLLKIVKYLNSETILGN